ncbi:MAG: hypothetical protein HQM12_22795, partial [SAR324 cluster bacterium]|nr:hypothetical protein [SAR324 cluster bacterium]
MKNWILLKLRAPQLLIFMVLAVWFSGCGVEFGNPSDDGGGTTTASLRGIAAQGSAVVNTALSIWDSSGNLWQNTTSNASGEYRFSIPDNAQFPLLMCMFPEEKSPLCGLLESSPNTGETATRHMNPVTSQSIEQWLGVDLEDLPDMTSTAISEKLAATPPQTLMDAGNSLSGQVLGDAVAFSLFHEDPEFTAKSATTSPSVADLMIDGLNDLANEQNQNLDAYLDDVMKQGTAIKAASSAGFQVKMMLHALSGGVSKETSEQVLSPVYQDADTRGFLTEILTALKSAKDSIALSISDEESRTLAIDSMAETLSIALEQEQNWNTLKKETGRKLIENVLNITQGSLIEATRSQQTKLDVYLRKTALQNAARFAGYVMAYVDAKDSLSERAKTKLTLKTQTMISQVNQRILEKLANDTDADAMLGSLQTAQTEIHQIFETALAEILSDNDVKAHLKPESHRPQNHPGLKASVSDKHSMSLDQVSDIPFDASSKVLTVDAVNHEITMQINFTYLEGQGVLALQGIMNPRRSNALGTFTL